jgi:DNA-binding CsgD family transcriptional regulator
MASRSAIESLYPQLAELALEIPDQGDFRSAWLTQIAATLGIDSATVCSSSDGQTFSTHTINGDEKVLRRDMSEYVAEIEMRELLLLMSGGTVLDGEFFSAQRRDELRVYREYLLPLGAVAHAKRCWLRSGRMFFFFFSKLRGTKSFQQEDVQGLDALFPVIALGEALHAVHARSSKHAVADLGGISAAESKVVSLAQRGLTNDEISSITGTRPRTIRNQLSSAYRKLGVSNRTELSYVLSGIDWKTGAVRGQSRSAIEEMLAKPS